MESEAPFPPAPGARALDVRPILERGGEPFAEIMGAVAALAPGQALSLRAPFEPKPLYAVLEGKGFAHRTRRLGDADWVVEFRPAGAGAGEAAPEIDVRGLEPPEPMVRILERCRSLAEGGTLRVVHDHRPELLYPRLEALGLAHATTETPDGLIHLEITRPPRGA